MRETRLLQAFLHLLLKISESVTRLESLLLISTPSDEERGPDMRPVSRNEEEQAEER
jgi:conserved oligomeric Golgi complex subunit 2